MTTSRTSIVRVGLRAFALAGCVGVVASAVSGEAGAQTGVLSQRGGPQADFVPESARDTGVTQRIGEALPLDLEFVDTHGSTVRLGDLFGERPMLVTFNYSDCPQLCSLQLVGLTDALREMGFTVGEEYGLVTISIDPNESTERAGMTQNRYFEDYLRADDARTEKGEKHTARRAEALADLDPRDFGWQFLTGSEENIAQVTDAAGYAFNLDPDTGEYAHDAVVLVVTPDGTISRYLPGVVYEPRDIELALISASQGELGGIVAWTRMFCYRWDPDAGTYVRSAERLMLLGAGGSALVLLAFLGLLWRREFTSRKRAADKPVASATSTT